MKTVSVAEAKNTLPELVHEAQAGRPVRITRRGLAAAVLVGEAEYERLVGAAGPADFAAWAQAWRAQQEPGFEGISAEELARWREV